ncbi:MAG: hypothetical protein JNM00_08635 [Flavobacteriales bacterium]|nr:hypothetical protein [Flavobacteriales bacterium]
MEENINPPQKSGSNRTLLIAGGAAVLLCLCVICVSGGFFLFNNGTFDSLSAEPTAIPTFAMPTIPPVPTAIVIPTSESSSLFEPSPVSNIRTANDQEGNDPNITFGAFDTIYVVGDLAGAVEGDVITSRWFAEAVVGLDPNFLIDEGDITVGTEVVDYVYFFFEPPTDGWPTGIYRVEILYNGVQTGVVNFFVQ